MLAQPKSTKRNKRQYGSKDSKRKIKEKLKRSQQVRAFPRIPSFK